MTWVQILRHNLDKLHTTDKQFHACLEGLIEYHINVPQDNSLHNTDPLVICSTTGSIDIALYSHTGIQPFNI